MTVIVQMLPSDWLITGSSCPAVGVDCLHSSADFSNLLTWRWPNRGGAEISISFLVEQQEKIRRGQGGANDTNQKLKECSCPQSNPQTYSACARAKVPALWIGSFSIRDIYIFNKDLNRSCSFLQCQLHLYGKMYKVSSEHTKECKDLCIEGQGNELI